MPCGVEEGFGLVRVFFQMFRNRTDTHKGGVDKGRQAELKVSNCEVQETD